jgi:hypothetical protein
MLHHGEDILVTRAREHRSPSACFVGRLLLSAVMALGIAAVAKADPLGIDYNVILNGLTAGGQIEGHNGIVTFDGEPELIPNNVVPALPEVPGNDLIVTEHAVLNPNGSETLSFWIEGQEPDQPFPTPGAPLFNNDLHPIWPVSVWIRGIHWGDMPSILVSDLHWAISFGEVHVPVIPKSIMFGGGGTEAVPFDFLFRFEPEDFTHDVLGDATDLHFNVTFTHGPVIPEPSTITLLVIGMVAVIACAWRRRMAS